METWNIAINEWFQHLGIPEAMLLWTIKAVWIISITIFTKICTFIFRRFIVPSLQNFAQHTKTKWDDHLSRNDLMRSISRLLPPILWIIFLPFVFYDLPTLLTFILKFCHIYFIIVILRFTTTLYAVLYDISITNENLKNRPLKGIYQMLTILTIGIGVIFIISILVNKNATTIIAGLGASAAVLMLIFKDSILGLVAGVQLLANDMLRPGDWITMNKYGADGIVTEVSLTTVKVQNFDMTITTIPPYALVSDSFQNWRGMQEYGGRRIKRSIFVDVSTIRFCSDTELQQYREEGLILGKSETDKITNLSVLENYVSQYLSSHPNINEEMLMIVRTLHPVAEGVPLELYCFTRTTEWVAYEAIQDDVIAHIIAVMPRFDLRVYQRPSADDVCTITKKQ